MPTNATVSNGIERMLGFEKYRKIINNVTTVDVSKDVDFQKLFDDYYEVRRNAAWRAAYFKYFQRIKSTPNICYDDIIDYIYNNMKTTKGNSNPVEASFSSKMLATINPDMPILDSQVLSNMGLAIKGNTPQQKLSSAKETYGEICKRYKNYIGTSDCQKAEAIFDTYFPNYTTVSTTKKIDWFLWGFAKKELQAIGIFGALL